MSPAYSQNLQAYSVSKIANKYANSTKLPKNWTHALIKQGAIAPNIKQLKAEALSPTPGRSSVKFKLIN